MVSKNHHVGNNRSLSPDEIMNKWVPIFIIYVSNGVRRLYIKTLGYRCGGAVVLEVVHAEDQATTDQISPSCQHQTSLWLLAVYKS